VITRNWLRMEWQRIQGDIANLARQSGAGGEQFTTALAAVRSQLDAGREVEKEEAETDQQVFDRIRREQEQKNEQARAAADRRSKVFDRPAGY
jgi:hypothetical protein